MSEVLHVVNGKMRPAIPGKEAEFLVVHLFGWKWMSWIGRPMRGHPQYDDDNVRVRQLLSDRQLKHKSWKEYLAEPEIEAREATGDEPLDYTYCSSGCSAEPVPDFLGVDDHLVLERVRAIWKGTDKWDRFVSYTPHGAEYKLGDFSRAAIRVLTESAA